MTTNQAACRLAVFAVATLLTGCATYLYQPTRPRAARLGEETSATNDLRRLPPAKEKVVAAVYKFRDQTGQYKQTETGAGFSTAVSQGTTNILLKALEESGWFVPIERENVGNLLNERKIVRSSVAQFKDGENLPPLLYAGIILEGGVVSYDATTPTSSRAGPGCGILRRVVPRSTGRTASRCICGRWPPNPAKF